MPEQHTAGPGPPDTAENKLPTAPEEQLQWLWIDTAKKQVCMTKRRGFRLLVFSSARQRSSFLQHAQALGYTVNSTE